ncbi:MAG: hypothetical protein VCC68_13555 [Myxococcota bacterium]|jgi:hypothetical protein
MALEAGTRLGHYEVVSSLGAGGMGEVSPVLNTWVEWLGVDELVVRSIRQEKE